MNVSTDFAPPFKLIAPYFILGTITLFFSAVLLLFIDLDTLHHLNPLILSWVHLFLLGFVMMIIFGAMAQLVPVVLEVGHFAVNLYYIIYPLLYIGVLCMCVGFYYNPLVLSIGGIVCFIAFCIFLGETFLTILKCKKLNFVIFTVAIANIFLCMGLIFGILLALNYAGFISIDILTFLQSHFYLVIFGFMGSIIIGMSLVLLPMFWLSHGFSLLYAKASLIFFGIAIGTTVVQVLHVSIIVEQLGYFCTFSALACYLIQIFIIFKKRARKKRDIYFKNIVFAYSSLFVSLVLSILYFVTNIQNILYSAWWFALFGFITFLIMGHLYKIVPFLVWYEKFSLHVGKRKVPMLEDMVPKKSANFQFTMQAIGSVCIGIALFFSLNIVLKCGAIAIIVGVVVFMGDILFMIRFKESSNVH